MGQKAAPSLPPSANVAIQGRGKSGGDVKSVPRCPRRVRGLPPPENRDLPGMPGQGQMAAQDTLKPELPPPVPGELPFGCLLHFVPRLPVVSFSLPSPVNGTLGVGRRRRGPLQRQGGGLLPQGGQGGFSVLAARKACLLFSRAQITQLAVFTPHMHKHAQKTMLQACSDLSARPPCRQLRAAVARRSDCSLGKSAGLCNGPWCGTAGTLAAEMLLEEEPPRHSTDSIQG